MNLSLAAWTPALDSAHPQRDVPTSHSTQNQESVLVLMAAKNYLVMVARIVFLDPWKNVSSAQNQV